MKLHPIFLAIVVFGTTMLAAAQVKSVAYEGITSLGKKVVFEALRDPKSGDQYVTWRNSWQNEEVLVTKGNRYLSQRLFLPNQDRVVEVFENQGFAGLTYAPFLLSKDLMLAKEGPAKRGVRQSNHPTALTARNSTEHYSDFGVTQLSETQVKYEFSGPLGPASISSVQTLRKSDLNELPVEIAETIYLNDPDYVGTFKTNVRWKRINPTVKEIPTLESFIAPVGATGYKGSTTIGAFKERVSFNFTYKKGMNLEREIQARGIIAVKEHNRSPLVLLKRYGFATAILLCAAGIMAWILVRNRQTP